MTKSRGGADATTPSAAAVAAKPPRQKLGYATNFTSLLDCLVSQTSGEHVTLGQLMDIAGRRSFGPVILLLGFIWISPLTIVPGANWLVSAVTLLFTAQLLFGRTRPWLPKKMLDVKFPRRFLEASVGAARKTAHVADKLTAPRLAFLTEPPFVMGVALVCMAAALVTFPLGLIPFGPVLPGISIVLVGIGMTARDGVFLGLSMLALCGSALLLGRLLL